MRSPFQLGPSFLPLHASKRRFEAGDTQTVAETKLLHTKEPTRALMANKKYFPSAEELAYMVRRRHQLMCMVVVP